MSRKNRVVLSIVDFHERLDYRLFRYLEDHGFSVSNRIGIAIENYREGHGSIGVLSKEFIDETHSSRRSWFRNFLHKITTFSKKKRRIFIGVIWFDNASRNATADNWVFELYGRENLSVVEKLVSNLIGDFNVWITIQILKDELVLEEFTTDGCCD